MSNEITKEELRRFYVMHQITMVKIMVVSVMVAFVIGCIFGWKVL